MTWMMMLIVFTGPKIMHRSILLLIKEVKEKLRQIDLIGNLTDIVGNVGGTTIGRPYISGDFHTSNGIIAFTYGKTDRPADIAIVENRKTRVLTQLNEDIWAIAS